MTGVAERLAEVRAAVAAAARAAGRAEDSVCLVAVSKRHGPEAVEAAYAAGQRDFGENYAQEMRDKAARLAERCPGIRWHFIGRVQTNKAGLIGAAHLVHGVGSHHQLEGLQKRAPVDVLLQVNVGAEEQKNGFSIELLERDFSALHSVAGGRLRGLMAMPPEESPEQARVHFAEVRATRDRLVARHGVDLPFLSMGMSSDFREAILEGATHVRVGTAIFGPRGSAGGGGA